MTLSPESRLALLTAVDANAVADGVFAAWQACVELDALPGAQYQLLPLVYANLERAGVTHPWLPRVTGYYRKMWYANRLALRTLVHVIDALGDVRQDALVVGAAAHAVTVYAELALRPITTIEILVPVARASAAARKLAMLGWRPEPGANRLQQASFYTWVPAQRFVNAQGQTLSLGWHLLPGTPCVDLDAAGQAASEPLLVEGSSVRTLCPSDHLLRACVNADESNLIAFVDAVQLLRTCAIDWARLVHLAGAYRVSMPVFSALETIATSLNVPLPATVLSELHGLPATADDRRRQAIAGTPPSARSRRQRLTWLYGHYRRTAECAGIRPGPRSFMAFLQEHYRLDSLWQLPSRLIGRLGK